MNWHCQNHGVHLAGLGDREGRASRFKISRQVAMRTPMLMGLVLVESELRLVLKRLMLVIIIIDMNALSQDRNNIIIISIL